MSGSGITVRDETVLFREARDSLRVLLAQISPAYDEDLFCKEFVAKVRDPDRQADRIAQIIARAVATEVDLLLFPELVAPVSHLLSIEDALRAAERDLVACIPYEHTSLGEFLPLLRDEEVKQHGLRSDAADTRLVNFSRIFVKAGDASRAYTQIKLTPFSGEFSLSSRETLACGSVLHRFVTNWGTFIFLICKDYVGEVETKPRMPMFDFLRSLAGQGLHYVLVSALNPEPEAFVHAARSFYYMHAESNSTFSVFLNGSELGHTAVVFPGRPHPSARAGKELEILPLFETKPSWGTQVRFPERAERLISATLVRLDSYAAMPAKGVLSPVYETQVVDLTDLNIPSEAASTVREKRAPAPHNLPPELTSFINREAERAEIARLLDDPSCRLVTLVGPGGIGKSRLALRVASEKHASFSHGAWLVSLAPITSPEFLVSRVGESLGFSFYGLTEAKKQLLDYLREKEMLLLLDNLEHLLEGVDLVADILQAAPRVKILATSRERLNLQHERVLRVLGMSVPEEAGGAETRQSPAVRLFEEGAGRTSSGFALTERDQPFVVRICQLVGGMPLAIELAASWVRVLSPQGILQEIERGPDFLTTSMRDIPDRHRSVRAVFEHSWKLLTEPERQALMRLSTFRGGFSRQAAEIVADVSLSTLSSLIDKSFVRLDPSERYDMLGVLRHYAKDKLTELPEERCGVHDRHSRYYAGFLGQRADDLRSQRQRKAVDEVARETENIRAGWDWAVDRVVEDSSMVPVIDEYLSPLHSFYEKRGWYQDGARAFSRATAQLREVVRMADEGHGETARALGRALSREGAFNALLGNYGVARRLLEEGLRMLRTAGMKQDIAFALNALSHVAVREGSYGEARKLCEDSVLIGRETGERIIEAKALNNLGNIAMQLGEYAQARELHEQGLAIGRALGDLRGIAGCLNGLGNVAYNLGDAFEARKYYEESLRVLGDLENRMGMSVTLSNLGNIAMGLGEYSSAKELFEESLEIATDVGFERGIGHGLYQLGNVHERLQLYDEARRFHERSLAVYQRSGDRRGAAYTLKSLGKVLFARQDHREARRMLEEAVQIFRELGVRRGVAAALADLGEVDHAMGETERSTAQLAEALEIATAIGAVPIAVAAILAWARVLQHGGELEQAARLCAFAESHKASSASIGLRDTAEQALGELASELPAEPFEAAVAAGKALTLQEIADELLGGAERRPRGEAVS